MKIMTPALVVAIGLTIAAQSATTSAQTATPSYSASYGNDRAQIQDLQSRYVFAFDFNDADAYASTFTEDGILEWARGAETGREALRTVIRGIRANREKKMAEDRAKGLRPTRSSHHITNTVLKIDGNRATGRSYWFQYWNENAARTPVLRAYGHSEDEYVKKGGKWFFKKRKIFNEILDHLAADQENPAW